MIVSGFTQRTPPPTDEDLEEFPGCHTHCLRCRDGRCKHPVDDVTTCCMTSCQGCGFRFHACKSEEHVLICQEERVECINSIYGCPHLVKRSNLASHLPVCPASVVCCGEEWSRWPMYTKEEGVKHSLPPTKTYIDCGQLDVGLAMRDQRMLIDSLRAPAKLKRTLRNPLTQKYPAAPIDHKSRSMDLSDPHSGSTSQTISDDDTDAPWNLSRRHPGLKESISSHLVSVSQKTKEELMSVLTNSNTSTTSPVLSEKQGSLSPSSQSIGDSNLKGSEYDYDKVNSSSYKVTERTQLPGPFHENETLFPSNRRSVSSERSREGTRSRSISVLRDLGGSQLHKILGVRLGDENEEDEHICLHKILGLSLRHDVINKYVGKPASMYTFLCAQNFRRDQFRWHFKNVHEDIVAQLDGFLEQRCPLAYAGCSFSFQRLVPSQPDTDLHFSWLQESFGVKSMSQPYCTPSPFSSSEQNVNSRDLQHSSEHSSQARTAKDTENANHEHNALNSNINNSNAQPSISDLANFDKDFDELKVNIDENIVGIDRGYGFQDLPSLSPLPSGKIQSQSPPQSSTMSRETHVQPVVFTAFNPDSKVLLVYNVEDEWEESSSSSLTDLPFEILQQIAKRLDSFSLCNLSLTCRILRDVCCTLLDDFAIVLLNWERHQDGDKISWKVSNKRWIFSTSFEPIRSWKFNSNHVSIADHLKVCPFNQDKVTHSAPQPIFI